ncbi:MAG: zf-HC2 domain-containing protein [Fimbriimonadales bacterium]
MQLQNFECQIAKGQIGRYLAGDALSDETLRQLEAHVTNCPACKQNLAERRAVLQAMLSPGEPEGSSETNPAPKPRFDLAELIRSKVQSKQPVRAAVQAETKPATFTKPALYSLALGAVLIGMSYVSRNMSSMLGPTAANAIPVPPIAKTTPTPVSPGPSKSPDANAFIDAKADVIAQQTSSQASRPVSPPLTTTSSANSKPRLPRNSSSQRPSHPKSPRAHHASANAIRVYAPEN